MLNLYVSFFDARSVNEVICHGIPDTRPLEDGDILNSESVNTIVC